MYRPHLFGPSSIHLYGRCGIGQSPQGWATLFGVIIGLSAIAWQARVGFRNIISSPNSGSAEVSPSHLDAKLPPGVEIRSGISGTDLVYDEAASWTNPGGYIQIGFQGLTPGAVYALGCAFMLQSKGDTIQFDMGNQTTTLTPTLDTGDSVAFIAPPEGSLSIHIKPSSSNWYWYLCKVATVN